MRQSLVLLAAGSIVLLGAAGPSQPSGDNGVTLVVGESATVCVHARPHWNHTCVQLQAGGRYRITAKGVWWDGRYEYGPDGGPSPTRFLKALEGLRRMKDRNWFELICAVNTKKAFAVGRDAEVVAEANGELTCYANDVWINYCNNTGAIQMTVKMIELVPNGGNRR